MPYDQLQTNTDPSESSLSLKYMAVPLINNFNNNSVGCRWFWLSKNSSKLLTLFFLNRSWIHSVFYLSHKFKRSHMLLLYYLSSFMNVWGITCGCTGCQLLLDNCLNHWHLLRIVKNHLIQHCQEFDPKMMRSIHSDVCTCIVNT